MFKLIVIVEKSKIIQEGLAQMLRSHEICQRVIKVDGFDNWTQVLGGSSPDVVIVNPELVRDDVEKIRTKLNLQKKTFFVGIIYLYYSLKEVTEMFDEAVFITDPEDIFVNKFRNLFNRTEEIIAQADNERLTDREKDVLRLLVRGLSNKEVAQKLMISPHTVVTHRKNIIEKTGIRSLAGLAVYSILNNIAEMDDLKK